MRFSMSAIHDFKVNAESVKPQPIAVLFKTMDSWVVLCFAADKTDAEMAIGQEMAIDHTNNEFLIYGAPTKYLIDTCHLYKQAV
ncbi:TPA: hypothetical protein OMT00_001853 [Klebsiella aerogenes]|nr:hypothetical protein [Klebsiella aerogenes]